MGSRRQSALSKSIRSALFRDPNDFKRTTIGHIQVVFSIYYIELLRYADILFQRLRNNVWQIDENGYLECFEAADGVKSMGDLGFSGSTFFSTSNSKFLIKSLPRHFEHSFFRRDLLQPYYMHMCTNPDSLLVWITDYVFAPYVTIGSLLRTTPAHHIIMENTLCGKSDDPAKDQWETYDLKPVDYFYPERDLVPDPLLNEKIMEKLGDRFEDKLRLSPEDYSDLIRTMRNDTKFLQESNAVDYSLFLVRYPASSTPGVVGRKNRWRVGVPSSDGKWKYRAVLLDFFWARHKLHAQAMTGVVQTFNMIGRQGPMTIMTTAEEYREKFLEMAEAIVEVDEPNPEEV